MNESVTPEQLAAGAEEAAGFAVNHAKQIGIELDYSLESLALVETLLARMHDALPRPDEPPGPEVPSPEDVNAMISIYGAYVGEVIRRVRGGEWQLDDGGEDREPSLNLVSANGWTCSPPTKVAKRVIQGPEDNVHDYVRILLEQYWTSD